MLFELAIAASLLGGCTKTYVDFNAAIQAEWDLELGLVDHDRIPKNLAWLRLSNRSTEDKLICFDSQAWAVTVDEGGRRHSRVFPGPLGGCDGVDRYQLVRAGAAVVFPLEIEPHELPTAGPLEFGFMFDELPWPPLLGEAESRSARWSGTLVEAQEDGKALIDRPSR